MNLSRSRRADYFWVFLRHQTIAICLRTILAIDGKTNNTKSSFSRCSIHNLQITYCMQSRLNVYILCLPFACSFLGSAICDIRFQFCSRTTSIRIFLFFFRYTMAGCKMLLLQHMFIAWQVRETRDNGRRRRPNHNDNK